MDRLEVNDNEANCDVCGEYMEYDTVGFFVGNDFRKTMKGAIRVCPTCNEDAYLVDEVISDKICELLNQKPEWKEVSEWGKE